MEILTRKPVNKAAELQNTKVLFPQLTIHLFMVQKKYVKQ